MVAAEQGPLQIPAISFDLGDEWEDWEDFDDQKLLQASESQSERRIQQRDESNMSGGEKRSYHLLEIHLFIVRTT